MREILFRAKNLIGEWVYGYYHQKDGLHYIDDDLIVLNTLGQYTGLDDKNDNKIFEGDILARVYSNDVVDEKNKTVVEYTTDSITNCGCCNDVIAYGYDFSDFDYAGNTVIIGNIYDETKEKENEIK